MVSVGHLIFDCRMYCGLSRRMQGSSKLVRVSKSNVSVAVFFQVESHVRDHCVMTMVPCPYEGVGCTFHVSSIMIERFGNYFVFERTNLTCTVRKG